MSHIVLDSQTLQRFGLQHGPLEVRDETGKIVGWFTPAVDPSSVPSHLRPKISQEEIDRRSREGGGRPLAEIMADLEKRT